MLLDLLGLTLLLGNASFSDGRLPIVVSKEISGDSSYFKLMSFMDGSVITTYSWSSHVTGVLISVSTFCFLTVLSHSVTFSERYHQFDYVFYHVVDVFCIFVDALQYFVGVFQQFVDVFHVSGDHFADPIYHSFVIMLLMDLKSWRASTAKHWSGYSSFFLLWWLNLHNKFFLYPVRHHRCSVTGSGTSRAFSVYWTCPYKYRVCPYVGAVVGHWAS